MANAGQMRITLILHSGDDPRLFEELERLPKGRRRAHRLRALALEGLLAARIPAIEPKPVQAGADELALAAEELLGPTNLRA